MTRTRKTFTLDNRTIDELIKFAEEKRVHQSTIVELGIRTVIADWQQGESLIKNLKEIRRNE